MLKCNLIQERLKKAAERLISRRLDAEQTKQTMQDIRLIEFKLRRLSPLASMNFRKAFCTFGSYLQINIPQLARQYLY